MEQHTPKKLLDQVRDGTCLPAVRNRLDQSPLGGFLTGLAAIPTYTWFRSISSFGYGCRYTCWCTQSGTG